jgi:hypothetical protein
MEGCEGLGEEASIRRFSGGWERGKLDSMWRGEYKGRIYQNYPRLRRADNDHQHAIHTRHRGFF